MKCQPRSSWLAFHRLVDSRAPGHQAKRCVVSYILLFNACVLVSSLHKNKPKKLYHNTIRMMERLEREQQANQQWKEAYDKLKDEYAKLMEQFLSATQYFKDNEAAALSLGSKFKLQLDIARMKSKERELKERRTAVAKRRQRARWELTKKLGGSAPELAEVEEEFQTVCMAHDLQCKRIAKKEHELHQCLAAAAPQTKESWAQTKSVKAATKESWAQTKSVAALILAAAPQTAVKGTQADAPLTLVKGTQAHAPKTAVKGTQAGAPKTADTGTQAGFQANALLTADMATQAALLTADMATQADAFQSADVLAAAPQTANKGCQEDRWQNHMFADDEGLPRRSFHSGFHRWGRRWQHGSSAPSGPGD